MAHKPDERCAVSAPEIDRLNRWRHFGDGPSTYTAGSKQFGDDVIVALIEVERLQAVERAAQAAYDYHMTGYNAADDFDANTQIELMDALGRALEPKPVTVQCEKCDTGDICFEHQEEEANDRHR